MWELDHKESGNLKNLCFWTVILEKTLESPLDCKEIRPVHPTGNQSWIFIGRTDAEAKTPILWPPHAKTWLICKDPDAGRKKAGGEGDDRGWDSWMTSLTQWTWVWVNSGSCWWIGRPVVLQSMGLQRVGHWGLLSDMELQGDGCCKGKHQIQDVFSVESKENRCSSWRVRGQKSKVTYRHAELEQLKFKKKKNKLGMFRPAHSSLCCQKKKRKKKKIHSSFFFFFTATDLHF